MVNARQNVWTSRANVLVGRAASGLIPLAVVGIAARSAGLAGAGDVAALVSGAMGLAELADVSSQRHLVRIEATADAAERDRRVHAFWTLRWTILSCGSLLAIPILIVSGRGLSLVGKIAVASAAAWFLHTNWQYARALALDRFDVVGIGPLLALGVSFGTMVVFRSLEKPDLLLVTAVALHAGKGAEAAYLRRHLGRGASRRGLGRIREEWKHVRFLFGQGLLSAGNAKMIIPLAAFSAGPAAAAILSISLSMVSVVSIAAVAIVIPSYRRWATGEGRWSVSAVLRRSRTEWLLGAAAGAAVVGAVWTGLVGWLLRRGFHFDGPDLRSGLVVVLSGAFEPAFLLAGAIYQTCHRDRLLLALGVLSMAFCWTGLVIGGRLGGAAGMCDAFVAARVASVLVVCGPLVHAVLRSDA